MIQEYFAKSTSKAQKSIWDRLLVYINRLIKPELPRPKTHNLQNLKAGKDYFIDFAETGETATLTTHKWIKQGDLVQVSYQGEPITYYAQNIDIYCNSDTLQTVWLSKVDN